ncbi:MGH1-like glycoside hydrolase domain-containing protein [Enemella evansiae]|uniref:MGH1-like glycoside hydrolase domain-containing protein n=1 Tax=Enemella evansiae TaxID=2016499 RepID=UPI001E5FD74B|nr:hypothetical protein [Enemella evansiae]
MDNEVTAEEVTDDEAALRERALTVLADNWVAESGWTVPNPDSYPHLWLWDSAFHAIARARFGDPDAVPEVTALLGGQLAEGMVPHMRYGPAGPDTFLGPLPDRSSLTQPPFFSHALAELQRAGIETPAALAERAVRHFDWLWRHRLVTDLGLLAIVHPWEAGNDHSPRFDGWGAPGRTPADYDQRVRSQWNKALMASVRFAPDGAAVDNDRFRCAPAGFNAYVAFNLRELGQLLGRADLTERADRLAAAIDDRLWQDGQWVDLPLTGGTRASAAIRISDGLMPALVTADRDRAERALAALGDPQLFGGTAYGPTNVARNDPAYDPTAYWRGAAWPNLNYLFWLAARRWGRTDLAAELARSTRAGAVASDWSEYWNPETGQGYGASPQSWTALAALLG